MLASRATEPRKEIAPHALQRPERLADRAMPMLQPVRVRGAHLHAVEQSHLRDWRPQQGKVGAQFFSVIIRSQQAAPGLPAWRVRRVIGYSARCQPPFAMRFELAQHSGTGIAIRLALFGLA